MQIVAASENLASSATVSVDSSGREHLVVVSKATWRIPQEGQRPRPMPPQPLAFVDQYHGEPGDSAMRYGDDFARFKARCDVLFAAQAYSPDGQPFTQLEVFWQVGALNKRLLVKGQREWRVRMGQAMMTEIRPVISVPLHYGFAWGGSQRPIDSEQYAPAPHPTNPAGLGWFEADRLALSHGQVLPSLEVPGEPVESPRSARTPAAFSAVPRDSEWRRRYAGTYDAAWKRDQFPLPPIDFDERFYQCAPEDQQMVYPTGGEEVTLQHMVAGRPLVRFKLPRLDLHKVHVLRTDYSVESPKPVVDTVFFEPDEDRFSVVWRASVPIRRRIQEFDTIAVGAVNPAWWLDLMEGRCINCGEAA
ncbi:DUF2169 family type VI secretion system accessory protein [Roseateles amylovorans]|uniref:DUF2169 domain-containing protein n=1 Tax=Roseateles amylovorans TaxID=2978473 RepID=A0ABY6B6F9_9BURK|nr:DUF2169 domain-containing protein [Roseateles amylovorans]UXH80622.1 DUF2169 domain-containing protein [Roseateles amylovorans]